MELNWAGVSLGEGGALREPLQHGRSRRMEVPLLGELASTMTMKEGAYSLGLRGKACALFSTVSWHWLCNKWSVVG